MSMDFFLPPALDCYLLNATGPICEPTKLAGG